MEPSSSNSTTGRNKRPRPPPPCAVCKIETHQSSICPIAKVISKDEIDAIKQVFNAKEFVPNVVQWKQGPDERVEYIRALGKTAKNVRDWIRCGDTFFERYINTKQNPCGACQAKKQHCDRSCLFAGAIPHKKPEDYKKITKVFNIKWVNEQLCPLNTDQRIEVLKVLLSEAQSLIDGYPPGWGYHIMRDKQLKKQPLVPSNDLSTLSQEPLFSPLPEIHSPQPPMPFPNDLTVGGF